MQWIGTEMVRYRTETMRIRTVLMRIRTETVRKCFHPWVTQASP